MRVRYQAGTAPATRRPKTPRQRATVLAAAEPELLITAGKPLRKARGAVDTPKTFARAAVTRRLQPAPWRLPMSGAAATAAVLLAAGCATLDQHPASQARVEPQTHVVRHAAGGVQGHYALGRYHDGMRAWDKAAQSYRLAIAAQPSNAEAHNALGVALARLGRYEEAELALRRALVLDPDAAHAHSNLGLVILLSGQPGNALAPLQQAVAMDPANATARENLRQARAQSEVLQTVQTAQPSSLDTATEPAPLPAPAMQQTIVVAAPITSAAVPAPLADRVDVPVPLAPAVAVAAGPSPAAVIDRPTVAAWPRAIVRSAFPPPSGEQLAEVMLPAMEARPEQPKAATPPRQSAPEASPAKGLKLEVSNGNGVPGMAARLGRWLEHQGVKAQRLTNQRPFTQERTVVEYRAGQEQAAQRVAQSLPLAATVQASARGDLQSDVRVVLGRDWQTAASCLETGHCPAPTTAVAMAR